MPLWLRPPTTPYHQQDQANFCGAAVAQMLLEACGAGIIDQHVLFDADAPPDAESPCPAERWFTSPQGLATMLGAHAQGGAPAFVRRYFTDREAALQAIVDALLTGTVAPAAVVHGMRHWVIVCGLQSTGPPVPGAVLTIVGLYINDPLPVTPQGPTMPPPHSAHDRCGSGRAAGIAHQYVTLRGWLQTYFEGWQCPGASARNFAGVFDAASRRAAVVELAPHRPVEPAAKHASRPARAEKVISKEAARRAAEQGIADHELGQGPLAAALHGARARRALLVRDLERAHAAYYLVVLYADGAPVATARVDAHDASLLGVIGAAAPILRPREVLAHVRASARDLGLNPAALDDDVRISMTLVWRHVLEFPSPYDPFYRISVGETHLYGGADGKVYRTLTDVQG